MSSSVEQNLSLSQYGELLGKLARSKVEFAVVGGLAVIFNGYPRFTLDADIIVNDTPENLELLLTELRGWGEGFAGELAPADFTDEEGAIRIAEDFELDVFTRLRGLAWRDFAPRLKHLSYGDVLIPYLSPQDLIHCKKNSPREKDTLDVIALNKIILNSAD